ncbi:Hypothetical predicted protein [Olea europaea subsp. europaea]|uniref:Uncharacterized protein n=1 Tax=Olea europaea subsp. europaea TaxID=158383 RepID=A0A8S0U2I9_OLEEU|nr:Hypothetical predicted protein [Olea europaea subsp. europaea]
MSPKKKEIAPRQAKEHVGEETSSQSTPIIQEPLLITPATCHQRSGLRSRPRLAVRLTREMVTVIRKEIVVPLEGSMANVPRRQASVFNRLGFTRNRQGRPPIPPAQAKCPPIASNRPHLINSFS